MSSYMVKTVTIDRVVDAIAAIEKGNHGATFSVEDSDKLGRDLLDLNAQAVKARYGEPEEGIDERKRAYRHSTRFHDSERVRYVALCCFLYQCTEGDVPDTLLFDRVRQVRRRLAESIAWEVCQADERTKGAWG